MNLIQLGILVPTPCTRQQDVQLRIGDQIRLFLFFHRVFLVTIYTPEFAFLTFTHHRLPTLPLRSQAARMGRPGE
jgi:hypothetical protein